MKIQRLNSIQSTDLEGWGHNGYVSDEIFEAVTQHSSDGFSFRFVLKPLEKPYVKYWEHTIEEMDEFAEIIASGYSLGAYVEGKLAGLIICDHREWNDSLYIESLLIKESYRRKGIGKQLIEEVIGLAGNRNFRIIELETQNTNVPAIKFYRKLGFAITGLNLKHYKEDNDEIALFMTYDVNMGRAQSA